MSSLVNRFFRPICSALVSLEHAALQLTRPSRYGVLLGSTLDFTRSRMQLIVLHRRIEKPRFTPADRLWLVLLASMVRRWKEALLIIKPNTLRR